LRDVVRSVVELAEHGFPGPRFGRVITASGNRAFRAI